MKEEEISFANDYGERLSATLHRPALPSTRAVILGHCFTCSRHTTVLRQISLGLVAEGFFVLRFDFSGNGQSEGDLSRSTYSRQISEIKTAVGLLASTEKVSWAGLAGHSMGAMVAILAAPTIEPIRAVCGLAARSTVMKEPDLLTAAQMRVLDKTGRVGFVSRGRSLELTREMFSDAAGYDLGHAVRSLRQPFLLIQGDQDEITPMAEAYRLQSYRPPGTKVVIIPGADHMFSGDEHRRMVTEVVVTWFKEQALGP